MSRSVKQGQQHRWLVSYADYMTLLCAFFIMMYAIELIDNEEGDAIRQQIEYLFSAQSSSLPPVTDSPLTKGSGLLPLVADIRQVTQLIRDTDDIVVEGEQDWLTVSLNADLLFAPGETRVKDAALPLLQSIAEELRAWPYPINVQGHADDTPVRGEITNWEISALRAAAVVQNLTLYGVAPQRMAAMGLSHYHPAEPYNTEEARRQNRRVVIFMTQDDQSVPWSRPRQQQ
ncbi:flagellar motor protein MotD [Bacterioplanes sanyensis]|uniref:OmpA family protein n=1 Tax=Bacterioplanes sanyensis TaxID=1249553 RepID=UPI00167B77B7|nr:OmpA family protein [Bacterioplanes sanyensis]GGY39765.1 flagellar motor protein MotD [Bacterioplanes sanyensis]